MAPSIQLAGPIHGSTTKAVRRTSYVLSLQSTLVGFCLFGAADFASLQAELSKYDHRTLLFFFFSPSEASVCDTTCIQCCWPPTAWAVAMAWFSGRQSASESETHPIIHQLVHISRHQTRRSTDRASARRRRSLPSNRQFPPFRRPSLAQPPSNDPLQFLERSVRR